MFLLLRCSTKQPYTHDGQIVDQEIAVESEMRGTFKVHGAQTYRLHHLIHRMWQYY